MLRNSKKALLPLMALAALAACDGGGGTESGASRLTIRLHDAPGDLAEAWVKVEEIYLQGNSSADSTSGRVVLSDGATEWIELTELTGSKFATLVNGEPVPAGSYRQLRFVVCEAYVVTDDGDVYATHDAELPAGVKADGTLQVPGGCSSGIKVKLPGGGLDVEAGGIGGTVTVAQGVTLPACGGAAVDVSKFVPLAIAGVDSLAATVSPAGQYSLSVPAGTYTMSHAQAISFTNGDSLRFTAAATPASVTVAAGATATSNYSITAASCKAKA
jgi:hypothetical protein